MPQLTQQDRHEVANRLKNSPLGSLDGGASALLALRGFCPTCSEPVTTLRDALSVAEYRISGMCQGCQDGIFGEDLEGPMEQPVDPFTFS